MGIGCFENLDSKNIILREMIHSSEPLVVDPNSQVRLEMYTVPSTLSQCR